MWNSWGINNAQGTNTLNLFAYIIIIINLFIYSVDELFAFYFSCYFFFLSYSCVRSSCLYSTLVKGFKGGERYVYFNFMHTFTYHFTYSAIHFIPEYLWLISGFVGLMEFEKVCSCGSDWDLKAPLFFYTFCGFLIFSRFEMLRK